MGNPDAQHLMAKSGIPGYPPNGIESMTKNCAFCLLLLLTGVAGHAQTNSVPFLNQPLIPTSVAPGTPGLILTVNGTGFASSLSCRTEGNPLETSS